MRLALLRFILRRIFDFGVSEGFLALDACPALAAMLFAALVAGVGRGVVETEPFADAGDVGFPDACIGRVDLYPDVGAVPHGLRHGMHESRAAIGIDRMVAAVIGDEYLAQLSAFGKPAGHRKHDAIAERHDGRFHVFGLVVSLRHGVRALQKPFEANDPRFVPKPYYQVFDAQTGFLPNLSIIDLLFNMGPEGLLVLKESFYNEE